MPGIRMPVAPGRISVRDIRCSDSDAIVVVEIVVVIGSIQLKHQIHAQVAGIRVGLGLSS
jgi:hypothetical protein